jgi:spermidine synthase
VGRVEVVELHAALVDWVRRGLVPSAKGLVDDARLTIRVGDVLDVVPALPRGDLDALLLDVDNGPGFLTHPGNTAVYSPPFLVAASRALARGGVLGVWSADPAAELAVALERACGDCEEVLLDVTRDGRTFTYAVYLARVVR